MVENIEGLGSKLKMHCFSHWEALEQAEVDVRVTRAVVCTDMAVAEVS